MIKRITIENYMAHKLTTLDLAPGVTVITGPNNAGKSAIVEAIRSIAQNPSLRHAIRHGAKSATVRIELDSGEIVEWHRTERATIYRIHKPDPEGEPGASLTETYAKFGRQLPEDVHNLLRLDMVETEGDPVDIHIGNQRQPIFLLNQAGSQAAGFFAASTEAEYLLKMQQALKSRMDRARTKRKETAAACSKAEKELERYAPLDDIDSNLTRTEELYAMIQKSERALPLIIDLISLIEATAAKHLSKHRSGLTLAALTPPPRLFDPAPLEALILESERALSLLNRRNEQASALTPLRPAPALWEAKAIEELSDRLHSVIHSRTLATCRKDALRILTGPPELQKVEPLKALIERLTLALSRQTGTEATLNVLTGIDSPPALSDTPALHRSRESIDRASDQLRAISARGSTLRSLQLPPEANDTAPLQQLTEALQTCERRVRLFGSMCIAMESLEPPPELVDLKAHGDLIASIARIQSNRQQLDASFALLNSVPPLPAVEAQHLLAETVDRLVKLEKSAADLKKSQQEQELALERKRAEIEQELSNTRACPLCGHPMDLMHFLESIHG